MPPKGSTTSKKSPAMKPSGKTPPAPKSSAKTAPAKSKPPSPAMVAAQKQTAIDKKLSGLLNKAKPPPPRSPQASKSHSQPPGPTSQMHKKPQGEATKKPPQKPSTAKPQPATTGAPALKTAALKKPANLPPKKLTSGGSHAGTASKPNTRRSAKSSTTTFESDDGEDGDANKSIQDIQADIDNLCGLNDDDFQEGEEEGEESSEDGVFHEPEGEPGRTSGATRSGYNMQESLGLGNKKTTKDNEENNALYSKILSVTRFGIKHYKFNPKHTKTKQDKRKEFAMYALLTREFPDFINTKRFPRLWCVPALTSYCFKNLRGYVVWKKTALAKKKAAVVEAESEAEQQPAAPAEEQPADAPTEERQSSAPPPLQDDQLSYMSDAGEDGIKASDSQETLVDPNVGKKAAKLQFEDGPEDGDAEEDKSDGEGTDNDEDDDEDEDEEELDEAAMKKFLKYQKWLEENPKLARAASRAASVAPNKVSKRKHESPAEDGAEGDIENPAPKRRRTFKAKNRSTVDSDGE